ncbi:MAG TPA: hypothetical protein VGF99_15930 [Myxococcota bacterium]
MSAACAEKQAVPTARAKADPAGLGVVIVEPTVRVTSGTSCAPSVTDGAAARFKSAATAALSTAGFTIVTDEKDQAFAAALDLEVDYCSDAGIVSGTTALELKRKSGGGVWRGQAVGDQARGETAASTLNELVETMLFDPRVIKATKEARE